MADSQRHSKISSGHGTTIAVAPYKSLRLLKVIQTEKQPKQICFHPERLEMYVANMNDASGRGGPPLTPGSLQVFSLPAGQLLHREPARTAVECLLYGRNLLYTDMFRDELVYFDIQKRQVEKRAAIKEKEIANFKNSRFRFMPKIIAPHPNGKTLAVSTWMAGVSILDASSGKLIQRIPKFCEHPRGLLYNTANELIVMCYGVPHGPGQIVVLDANEQYRQLRKIVTGGSPRHIVALDQKRALISNLGLGRIYLYDTQLHKILKQLAMPGSPNTIFLDPDGEHLYVSLRARNELAVVSVSRWQIVKRYPTGAFPTGLAVSPDGRYLAVSNFHAANLNLYQIER